MPPVVAGAVAVFTAVGAAGGAIGAAVGGLLGAGAAAVGAGIGMGIAQGVLVGALVGGATAAITGGDIGDGLLKGAMFGAVTGGILGGFSGVSESVSQFMTTAGAQDGGIMAAMSETYANAISGMSGMTGMPANVDPGMTVDPMGPPTTPDNFFGMGNVGDPTQTVTRTASATPTPTAAVGQSPGLLSGKMPQAAAGVDNGMTMAYEVAAPATDAAGNISLFDFLAKENELNRQAMMKLNKSEALWAAGSGLLQSAGDVMAEQQALEDEGQNVTTSRDPQRRSMDVTGRRTGFTGKNRRDY